MKRKTKKKNIYIKKSKRIIAIIRENDSEYLFPDLFHNETNQTTLIEQKEKPNIIDLGKRGIYRKNNKLNDLTGKEWKFATRSIITKVYPLNMQHNLRKQHGGQKPPELCADLIKTFTKEGTVVLDPLA